MNIYPDAYPDAMTVGALIKKLSACAPDIKVFIYEGGVVGVDVVDEKGYLYVRLETDIDGSP